MEILKNSKNWMSSNTYVKNDHKKSLDVKNQNLNQIIRM